MIHWDTDRDALPASMTVDTAVPGSAERSPARGPRVSDGAKGVFYVDGEEMFVATKIATLSEPPADAAAAAATEDYYVVM